MKLLILIIMLINISIIQASDCLPQSKVHLRSNNKYHLLTVKGDTYSQAEIKLKHQLPQVGFLQKIRYEKTRLRTNSNYFEVTKLNNKINANLDTWLKYECKYQGEYYITAVVPKDGVKYVDFNYSKELTLTNIKKWCGRKKVVILASDAINSFDAYASGNIWKLDFDIRRKRGRYSHFYVMCGDVSLKLGKRARSRFRYKLVANNRFDNFIAIGNYSGTDNHAEVKDLTVEMWMELTKNI